MQVDWRSLLNEIRVPWKDRGSNTSRGNVNVCCSECSRDEGFHCGISETEEAYFCFRNGKHAGRNFVRLLVGLKVSRNEAVRLLNKYKSGKKRKVEEAPKPEVSAMLKRWQSFVPAHESDAMLDYLDMRGFDRPERVAQDYDLRFAPYGKFSRRLLLPLHSGEQQISWTGRALSARQSPRYLMHENQIDGMIYLPRMPRRRLVIVEGPLDALKLAVGGEATDTASVALTGVYLGPARLYHLALIAQDAEEVYLALDATTKLTEGSRMLDELRGAMPDKAIRRAKLLPEYKDPGEYSLADAKSWLEGLAHIV